MLTASQAQLPLAKIIVGAVMLSWERRHALLRALWLPLLVGVAFTLAETLWGPSTWTEETVDTQQVRQGSVLLWFLPLLALTVIFAVRSYGVYLLGEREPRSSVPISWGMRETRFVFAMAGVAFMFISTLLVFGSVLATLWQGASLRSVRSARC